ncbi:hypothetical protein E4U17_003400 [Claviceps sp. LM77 group G4]|nr:hypothetical protein E4U17_003400 [Claviceps sp. LM77 group G4]
MGGRVTHLRIHPRAPSGLFWHARWMVDIGSAPPEAEDGTGASCTSASQAEKSDTQEQSGQTEPSKKSMELGGGTMHRNQDRQYCSQKCFSGLVRRDVLDPTWRTSYEQAEMARFEIPRSRLIEQADDKGVLHRDVGWENALINPETKGVMAIDFERAHLLDKSTSAGQDAEGELETPEKTTQQLRRGGQDDVFFAVQERLLT